MYLSQKNRVLPACYVLARIPSVVIGGIFYFQCELFNNAVRFPLTMLLIYFKCRMRQGQTISSK